ncbi:MAG: mechanosensitive ion channel family protein [Pseudomonadota bacterium]
MTRRSTSARFADAWPRALAAAAALALAAVLLPPAPAAAQGIDFGAFFGAEEEEAPPETLAPAAEDGADAAAGPAQTARAPDLAAYGQLEGYGDAGQASMVRRTTEGVSVFRQRLERVLREAPGGWAQMLEQLEAQSPDDTAGYFMGVALVLVILVLIGRAVVTLLAIYVLLPIMIAAQRGPPPVTLADKLPVLVLRFVMTLAAMALNTAVVLGLGLYLVPDHGPTQATAAIMLGTYLLYFGVDTVWRMILSPYLSDYRIPRITDTQARRLYLWISAAALVGITSSGYVQWLREMEVSAELATLNVLGFALLSMLLTLGMLWRNREAITRLILAGRAPQDASWIARLGGKLWGPLITLYMIVAFLEESFREIMGQPGGVSLLAGAFMTLGLGLVVFAVGLYVVERAFARSRAAAETRAEARRLEEEEERLRQEAPAEPETPEMPEIEAPTAQERAAAEAARAEARDDELRRLSGDAGDIDGDGDDEGGGPPPMPAGAGQDGYHVIRPRGAMRTYEALAARVVSLFALGTSAYVLVLIWVGPSAFAEDSPIDRFQDVLDTFFFGYIAYHAARIWLDRRIEEEGGDEFSAEPGDEGGGASAVSRLGTLLPLFRAAVLAVILASIGVIAATELGVNVAPLFAGAGIIGIAVGFGAQTLVRDILSGMFFLLDDAFRKGEYIDVGSVKGTVEKISLRSFQLRHHLGALHTIPFGEIQYLTNFSRDWVMMKLPLRLTYDTDVEKVRKLIKKLGQKLLQHPQEGHKFVQPLKSQGVYMMEDSAMIIRVKYMTRPGDQWTTRKLVYQELRELFEQEGVKFAHREVTVRIPGVDKADEMDEDQKAAIGAAARRAVDEADLLEGPGANLATAR